MMRKANVGKEKSTWKPPEGYKSALGRARDEAKAAEAKKKGGKVAALENADDTASDDDECDFGSEHGASSFSVYALTRAVKPRPVPSAPKICAVNRFSGLDHQQDYDPEVLAALNSWTRNVRISTKKTRGPKPDNGPNGSDSKIGRTANYIESNKKSDIIEVPATVAPRTDKETNIIVSQIASTMSSSKHSMARASRTIGNWKLEDGEIIALVDTGSFTHAIDADVELPDHDVEGCDPDAPGTSAETAGGGILKKLGTVKTKGTIDGAEVEVTWDHMKVSTPILSVRKLVKDGNDVYINNQGGYIVNLATGKRMKVFNFQGVYYLRMKVHSGARASVQHRPDFHRPGP